MNGGGALLSRSPAHEFRHAAFRAKGCCKPRLRPAAPSAVQQQQLQPFPQSYIQLVRDARQATQTAIADGNRLLEVEFPTYSLQAVAGDDDGANEMNDSVRHLREFCRPWQDEAAGVRVFFPDEQEMRIAQCGKAMDPAAGSAEVAPVFDGSAFQLDYLTTPNFLSDAGINIGQPKVLDRIKSSDKLYIAAYPSFNVNEIIAIGDLWEGEAKAADKPIVVFNGELDRIRSGYYPSLFYPKIGKLAKTLLPNFCTTYYIHNFKGSKGGVLFRVYPGPWQVLRRYGDDKTAVIHTQEEMPTLKKVALEILPNA